MRTSLIPFCLAAAAGVSAFAVDWPQVGGNPQHTNFTPDSPAPPYEVAWVADFSPEQIYSAQAAIAGGRAFQTTLTGCAVTSTCRSRRSATGTISTNWPPRCGPMA
ncbi:MAG TPA: hypothetical protein VNA25_07955 [Phycisphaerae bacterium]|nr:hypothetical protein [Phycisphaerae bacterium]